MIREDKQHRLNSLLQRETVAGRTVYLKTLIDGGWNDTTALLQARAAREAEIISQLASCPALCGRLGVVKIVHSNPASAEIATEEVPGEPLLQLLVSSRPRALRGSCTRAIYLAGKWLRAFQTIPLETHITLPSTCDPEDLVDYCELRIRALRDFDNRWPSEEVHDQILRWLDRRVEASSDCQLHVVWSHGDYGPSNLIWDGNRMTPIDFATCRSDLPLVDVTYLIHRLEMLRIQFPWRRWPLGLWRKACLRGYGVPQVCESPIYDALMARHLICRLLTLVRETPKNQKQRWHNAWVHARVQTKLMKLVNRS